MDQQRISVALLALTLVGACNLVTDSDYAISEPPDTGDAVGEGDTADAADAADVDAGNATNACGGSAALRYRGTARTPGERCGCTGTIVCASPDALQCANDVGNNACGGCGALPGDPGSACGACGGGRWTCDDGQLSCEGALERNLCGGCGVLDGAPGAPCEGPDGSRWECGAGDTVVCALPDRNLCGAFGDLVHDGLDAAPGEACEAGCGAGRLICDPETQSLFCDGPEPNGCGGCTPLAGPLGGACGCGDRGRWVCDGTGVACEGGDTNACGGCGTLAVQPGEVCSGGALRICVSRDATACATFGAGTNFCGGEVALGNLPGGVCGACESGTYACLGPDEVGCTGDLAAEAFNACGGCDPLVGAAGGPCGTCGQGTLRCSGTDAFTCEGDPGSAALNACGGCGALANAPDTACGTCAAWRCVGGGVQCLADPGAEGCGGARVTCAELDCGGQNRRCTEATTSADAVCGTCQEGYEERAGDCEPVATNTPAEVATLDVDAATISRTGVRLDGELTSLGSPAPSQHGFCRGVNPDPAIGAAGVTCSGLGALTATGPFSEAVGALSPGTTYRVRAYATNAAGTAYGENVQFTTLPDPPSAPTGVVATTDREEAVRVTWDPVAGATGYVVRIAGSAEVGSESPFDDTTVGPGTILPCTPTATTNTFADRVALACEGASVEEGPSQQYEVVAIGPGGRSEPSAAVTGRRAGGALRYAWERSSDETAAGFAPFVGAPIGASGDDASVPFNALRHYRVVLGAGAGVVAVTTASSSGRRGVAPTVESLAVSDVTPASARLRGAVTSLGGADGATATGFCWRVDDESSACAGASAASPCAAGWTNTAATAVTSPFEATVTLTPGTAYAACAYAANGVGVGHGAAVRFAAGVSPPATPSGVAATSSRASDVRVTWTAVLGATSYEVEIDGSGTWIAAASSPYTDTSASAPSLTACTAAASDGTSGTAVALTCTGDTAAAGVSRSYRVRAIGPGGTSGASASATGNRAAGARSYQWQRSAADSDAAYADIGAALASAASSDPMSGITPPAGRRYRVVISATGAASVTSNADRGYIAGLPGIVTQLVASGTVTATSALLEGSVSSLNGAPELLDHGFCVGPSANPAPGGPGVTCSSLGRRSTGAFSETVRSLAASTTYHVRAFGTNVAGTSFGTSRGFATLPPAAKALGELCAVDGECAAGLCSADAVDAANRRCVPRELPSAAGGAMEFRYVPATGSGGFQQGVEGGPSVYTSTITRAYFAGRTEVTQGQWAAATGGTNPSCFQSTSGTSCSSSNANNSGPVEQVDWWASAAYANWLSEQAGLARCYTFTPTNWDRTVSNWSDGDFDNGTAATGVTWSGPSCAGYRLLTESEWEWAARGPVASGTLSTAYYWGSSWNGDYLWSCDNACDRTRTVGGKLPNAYGLRDMSGNVWEWVWDWYDTYPSGSRSDYTGASTGSNRVRRGGSWYDGASALASAYRLYDSPSYRNNGGGFRLARTAP